MLARVTTWEGGTADGLRAATEEMRSNISEGPPEGVKSSGFMLLVDPDRGRALMIGLFDTEDDLNTSESALQEMNPPPGIGRRVARDIYEVGAEARM